MIYQIYHTMYQDMFRDTMSLFDQKPWYSWHCRIWYSILIVTCINFLEKLIWYRYDISYLYPVNISTFLIWILVPISTKEALTSPKRSFSNESIWWPGGSRPRDRKSTTPPKFEEMFVKRAIEELYRAIPYDVGHHQASTISTDH